MSAQSSTTHFDAEYAEPNILEKIESQKVPGELTPVNNNSVEKLDDVRALEAGNGKAVDHQQPITHRPTGIKVLPLLPLNLTPQWALIMFSFLIGLFLFALDNTIVADVQPAIVDEFQSVDKISWLATGFFLATVGKLPP